MIDPKMIDQLAEQLSASIPSGFRTLQNDIAKNFRASLEAGLSKLDLVTREEFEVQSAVLTRTREKLATLEKQLAELESRLK
jgi:ubiquinone biosynthesis accessory factor UbiK